MLALVGATTITAIPTPAQIPPAPPLLETPTTTYQVPDQTRPAAPDQATPTTLYRVIVDSSNFVVLQQVQQVAGDAFVESFIDGRDRIQAGAFENEFGARQRVNDLASIGVRAVAYDTQGDAVYQALAPAQTSPAQTSPAQTYQVLGTPTPTPTTPLTTPSTISANPTPAQAVTTMPRGYYTIVPIARDQVGVTFEALSELGISEEFMTVGQKLLGWHIAIGVYPERTGAETMSQYLRRRGGFDARTYFAP